MVDVLDRRAPLPQRPASGRAVIGGLATLAAVAAVMVVSVFYSMPSNVLSVRDGGDARVFWSRALPQGWAFFTKPPSDAELVAYTVDGADISYATTTPNSQARNLFGLTRKQRAQGPELAAMANQLHEWTDCGDVQGDCLTGVTSMAPEESVVNTAPVQTLCGPTVIVETEPVPFSYRHNYDGWRLDRRFVYFEAVCRD